MPLYGGPRGRGGVRGWTLDSSDNAGVICCASQGHASGWANSKLIDKSRHATPVYT